MAQIARDWTFSSNAIWGTSPWNARVRLAVLDVHSPLNGLDWEAHRRLMTAAPAMRAALEGVLAIRPSNWDDADDPDQVAAWQAVDSALEAAR